MKPDLSPQDRQRDLLPLPLLSDSGVPQPPSSRSSRRRAAAKHAWVGWANDGIQALNQLGCGARERRECVSPVTAGQAECLKHIVRCYRDVGKPPDEDDFGAGALMALCAKSSVYSHERTDIQPYSSSRVSWPPEGFAPMELTSGLGEDDKSWFGCWQHRLLRDPVEAQCLKEELGLKRPYLDPVLRGNRREYASFISSSMS